METTNPIQSSVEVIAISTTAPWRAWLDGLADRDKATRATTIERATVEYAKATGFPIEAPRRTLKRSPVPTKPFLGAPYADLQGLDQRVNPDKSDGLDRIAIAALRMHLVRVAVTRELCEQGLEPDDVTVAAMSAEMCGHVTLRCSAEAGAYLHFTENNDVQSVIRLRVREHALNVKAQFMLGGEYGPDRDGY